MKHTMKNYNICRLVSTFVFLLLSAVVINAVPVKPGLKRVLTLSDGTKVSAVLLGDEHGHYWQGSDGNAYQIVGEDETVQRVDVQQVRRRAAIRRDASNQRRGRRLAPRKVGKVSNYTGQKKGLIILVNFLNTEFKPLNTNALYQRIANEKDFSYGSFDGSMKAVLNSRLMWLVQCRLAISRPITVPMTLKATTSIPPRW